MTSSLHLASVTLRVPDLAASLDFYTRQLGFVAVKTTATSAELAVTADAPTLLTLLAAPDAPPAPRSAAGLFHAALLFPSRAALGAWLRFAAERGVQFDGFSDHAVSEALYFTDPHGNGLEFYADRPRDTWPYDPLGEVAMGTLPLDVESLLAAGASHSGPPLAGASWGHLHLRVTDLDRAEKFYAPALGLAVTQRSFPGARFMGADGYHHHHLGLNTWGQPRLPQPTQALGLAEAKWIRPGAPAQTLTDPDGMTLRIEPA